MQKNLEVIPYLQRDISYLCAIQVFILTRSIPSVICICIYIYIYRLQKELNKNFTNLHGLDIAQVAFIIDHEYEFIIKLS